jgi:hypothetical protein
MTEAELLRKLSERTTKETSLVERKPGSVNKREIRREACAFANSLPDGAEAVIFIGLQDATGAPTGIKNMDSLHKLIDEALTVDCYPAIKYETRELPYKGSSVLALIVPSSPKKPHFTGPAFVRNGAKTVVASEDQLNELVLNRLDNCRELIQYKNSHQIISVRGINYKLGSNKPFRTPHVEGEACKVEHCTGHIVRFLRVASRESFTEELSRVSISFDDKENRPMVLIVAPGR